MNGKRSNNWEYKRLDVYEFEGSMKAVVGYGLLSPKEYHGNVAVCAEDEYDALQKLERHFYLLRGTMRQLGRHGRLKWPVLQFTNRAQLYRSLVRQ